MGRSQVLLSFPASPSSMLAGVFQQEEGLGPIPFSPPHPGSICERVTPRLSHANSAVVLSAVKVLMKFMEMLSKDLDYYGTLLKKLAPPLVTLLSAEPELQYVALRNINLIVQKRWVSSWPCLATGASVPLTTHPVRCFLLCYLKSKGSDGIMEWFD